MLTAKRLRKVLSYAPTTGIFRWNVSASSRAPVGAIAGAKNGRGYRQIRVGGRPYSASRLAWLYMTGKWPNSEISYVNGKPSDTRWANLREAPSSQNRTQEQIAKAFAAGVKKSCLLNPRKRTSALGQKRTSLTDGPTVRAISCGLSTWAHDVAEEAQR